MPPMMHAQAPPRPLLPCASSLPTWGALRIPLLPRSTPLCSRGACVCVFVCMCVCDCEYGLRWSVCATARGARRNTGKHRVAGLAPSVARIWMVCSIWLSISMDLDLSGVPLRLAQFAKGSLRLSFRKNSVRKHPSAVSTLSSAARSVPPADGAARMGTGATACVSRRAWRATANSRTRCPAPPRPRSSLARVLTFRAPALQPQRRSIFARGRPRAHWVPGGLHVTEDGS